jgi:hypothetical protein
MQCKIPYSLSIVDDTETIDWNVWKQPTTSSREETKLFWDFTLVLELEAN